MRAGSKTRPKSVRLSQVVSASIMVGIGLILESKLADWSEKRRKREEIEE